MRKPQIFFPPEMRCQQTEDREWGFHIEGLEMIQKLPTKKDLDELELKLKKATGKDEKKELEAKIKEMSLEMKFHLTD